MQVFGLLKGSWEDEQFTGTLKLHVFVCLVALDPSSYSVSAGTRLALLACDILNSASGSSWLSTVLLNPPVGTHLCTLFRILWNRL
ncbi:hypothetical protein L1987_46056 [Smallanthus sonchifolius]|uniref:Uncharacterized protein n=1 Tax=Smallanthus sonchifolius TaxID=185202 RepID=A0ACB9FZN8_9ASTR|nr:hypothetical protein L1987_46056 [Smallanthus sonchifolius]